ncbi:AEC family transporter [Paracholeplasma manati]|uniref:AEC family transporter n=1 Tax=Paracholeplasma manati TaxID=591373 RepID=A0ABT2Y8C9_9MOLU|nr:AEC family transporter [Paracholeplasma manati]MCV2232757.1 AEC family transporter [Paracholeplasma manati]MDG0887935.1 AEC family transporter [Paracholeplasma manati]
MSTLWFAINAIMPIVLLIVLGYGLMRVHFFDEKFLKMANRFVFFIALPVLLAKNIYDVRSIDQIEFGIVMIALVGIFLLFLIGLGIVIWLVPKDERKGVVLQCLFRSNFAIIGLPLATSLGGGEAAALVSILAAFTIPLFNILAVLSLTMFNKEHGNLSFKKVAKDVVKNPLIIGVVVGSILLIIREFIPKVDGELVFTIKADLPFVYQAVKYVADIASPLALIVLGGQFKFKALASMMREVSIGVIGRLLFAPVLGFSLIYLVDVIFPGFEMKSSYFAGMIALFASPVAVSSAVMASEMKADESLAAQLVVWTSLFSVFTIFGIVVVLRSIGLI